MKNHNRNLQHKAFTLAEVLITLGIIGIVAAITIPILVNNSQKAQYATMLKKSYTELTQAFTQMAADNGCTGDISCTGLFVDRFQTPSDNALNALQPYIRTDEKCGYSGPGYCTPSTAYKSLNSSTIPAQITGAKLRTTSGYTFSIYDWDSSNCAIGWLPKSKGGDICADIFIDVNGPKGPNQWGRDLYKFYLTNTAKLVPDGYSSMAGSTPWNANSTNSCRTDIESIGSNCSSRIQEQGWQMDY